MIYSVSLSHILGALSLALRSRSIACSDTCAALCERRGDGHPLFQLPDLNKREVLGREETRCRFCDGELPDW